MDEQEPATRPGDPLPFRVGQRVRHTVSGRCGTVTAVRDDPAPAGDRYRYSVAWETGHPDDRVTADIGPAALQPI